MPHINIEVSAELLRDIRIACARVDATQKEWVLTVLQQFTAIALNDQPNDRADHGNSCPKVAPKPIETDPVRAVEAPVSAEVHHHPKGKRLTGEAFMALPYSEQLRVR